MEIHTTLPLFLLLSFLTCACSEDLVACLLSGGVTNITTYNSSSYFQLLNSSSVNLRYATPDVAKPFALIFPTNRTQVSVAIRCAKQASWEIRARCGGHSFEGLSYTSNTPFVIIDLRNLNRITIDLQKETAWVEGGATLGEVYYAIGTSSKKHAFSAGICPTVGSGGHISGGGYGALARKYGMGADNVLDAILIDAEGRMLDRKAMGEEIFWALRGGGGGSWGVVAAWKLRLLPVPETVTAFRFSRVGNTSTAAQIWHKWQMVAPRLEDEFFLSFANYPGNETTAISQRFLGLYLGPKATALKIITKAFPELNVTAQECKELSWVEAIVHMWGAKEVTTVEDLKNRTSYPKDFTKVKYDIAKKPVPLAAIKAVLEMVANQSKSSILLDPYGGAVNRIASDAIAFPHRDNLYALEYFVDWKQADDVNRDEYIAWVRKLYKYMKPYASKSPRAVYVNNLDLDLGTIDWRKPGLNGPVAVKLARAWGKKYFVRNYDRLVEAKTRIDPLNVFRNPQSIPPSTLLSSAEIESMVDVI